MRISSTTRFGTSPVHRKRDNNGQDYTLMRDSDKDFKFTGDLIGSSEIGEHIGMKLFKTNAGLFVCQRVDYTLGFVNAKSTVKIFDSSPDVFEFFGKDKAAIMLSNRHN